MLRAFLPATSPSLPIAVHINSIVLWGFVPFGVAFIFSGIVRATGAVWPPLLAMIISLWGVRVPLADFLKPHLGADAIWLELPGGQPTTLAAGRRLFPLGRLAQGADAGHCRPAPTRPTPASASR